jgi:hypothetical protein
MHEIPDRLFRFSVGQTVVNKSIPLRGQGKIMVRNQEKQYNWYQIIYESGSSHWFIEQELCALAQLPAASPGFRAGSPI